jgi:hypothetical protein
VTHEIRKACRAGGTQIKKSARQPLKQISEFDPAHQLAAWPTYGRGTGPAGSDGDLAELVWKYFAEEITEAVIEVQEALAPEQSGSIHQARHRKK